MECIRFILKNKFVSISTNFVWDNIATSGKIKSILWNKKSGILSRKRKPSYINTKGYKEWYYEGKFISGCSCKQEKCIHSRVFCKATLKYKDINE